MANIIKVHRSKLRKGDFTAVNSTAFGMATGRLTLRGLKVYNYLISNMDGFSLKFSPTAFAKWMGVTNANRIVAEGLRDLERNGFLKRIDDTHFEFYDAPQE